MKNRLVVLLPGLSLAVLAACGGVSTGEPLGELAQVDPVTQTSELTTWCGDWVCNGGETCSSCPYDCGNCPQTWCGDWVCNGGETCSSCPYDCGNCPQTWCGDWVCNGSETCSSCPYDCGNC